MTEEDFQDALRELIEESFYQTDDDQRPSKRAFVTFAEAGVLTRNRGLIVTLADGSSFHLTIVERSK